MGYAEPIIIDDFKEGVARSHLYRYYSARGFIEPSDIVVDAGCGYGYGTELLSRVSQKVIGLDRDRGIIQYAMKTHKRNNNYFSLVNLDQLERLPECDVLIAIEILEHLRFPSTFTSKAKLAAKKRIFISTPIVPTKHEDPTHLHDFTEQQIYDMLVDEDWGLMNSSLQGPYLLAVFYKKNGSK